MGDSGYPLWLPPLRDSRYVTGLVIQRFRFTSLICMLYLAPLDLVAYKAVVHFLQITVFGHLIGFIPRLPPQFLLLFPQFLATLSLGNPLSVCLQASMLEPSGVHVRAFRRPC